MTTRYEILPASQRNLLGALRPLAAQGFVLYGGTAIALQVGHRQSIDFDFFASVPLDENALRRAAPFVNDSVVTQREKDTLTIQTIPASPDDRPVKVSFFGNLPFGRVGTPQWTDDREILVASLDDLLGHKLKTLLQRVDAKDYRDIAALIRAGIPLARGLGGAAVLFPKTFPPAEALRALTYYQEGDFSTLAASDRSLLIAAAAAVRTIEPRQLRSGLLLPD